MTMIPSVAPPIAPPNPWARPLTSADPIKWLAQGWRDLTTQPAMSVAYGVLVFLISAVLVGGLIALGRDYILFPASAGFMVVGPILAVGLYERAGASRRASRSPGATSSSSSRDRAARSCSPACCSAC